MFKCSNFFKVLIGIAVCTFFFAIYQHHSFIKKTNEEQSHFVMEAVHPQETLDECVFVILGVTGDLSRRKLIPAIYKLIASGKLKKCALVGIMQSQTTADDINKKAKQFIPNINVNVWNKLRSCFSIYRMNFNDESAYQGLRIHLEDVESKHSIKRNRLFYLATMPQHFDVITKNLAHYQIAEKQKSDHLTEHETWSRLVYEKPFGNDLSSARQINQAIANTFDEKQVFRIDHYLGKELVGNIALGRFTNRIVEPLWSNEHIDSVQIIISEKIGIEGRGAFYDSYGALKDVVQNHILQILALVGMEAPEKFTAEQLRDAKAAVLKNVEIKSVILGQYDGYLNEKNVKPDSKTETFAALKVTINNDRWQGVPFYLKTGKCLDKYQASVHIRFKMVPCLLDFCPTDSNYLTINIQPNDGLSLEVNVKKPEVFNEVTPITMNFSYSSLCGPNTPAAYEILLSDVIKGDHFAFVRSDEIEYAWKIIEQLKNINSPLYKYEQGSSGPKEISLLDSERTIKWRA